MGLVPQEDSLDLELTVLDNLMIYGRYFDMPKKVIRERADQLLDFAQLGERAHDRVDPLSGGMKRRLTIARALISDPDLLILDEPTTGLDPQARHLLWDRLYRLKQDGVTLVITTHYMDEAEQLCDRLVVMDKGRFAAEGTPRQLIEAFSTREVVELRFAPGQHEEVAPSLVELAERLEVLPDRILLYTDDGDAALAEVARMGHVAQTTLVRRSTLEDVFLRLTGAAWSTDDDGGEWRGRRREPTLFRHGEEVRTRRIATPMWLRAARVLGLPVQADLAQLRRDELPHSPALPGRHGGRSRLAHRQALPRRGTASAIWPSWLRACWRARACRSARTTPRTRSWGRSSGCGPTWPSWRRRSTSTTCCSVIWPGSPRGSASSSPSTWRSWRAFGVIYSPWAVLALPAGVLTGMAFAAPISAFAATLDTDAPISTLYRFAIIPLFLFSGTFFPVSQLPAWLQVVAYAHAAVPRRGALP